MYISDYCYIILEDYKFCEVTTDKTFDFFFLIQIHISQLICTSVHLTRLCIFQTPDILDGVEDKKTDEATVHKPSMDEQDSESGSSEEGSDEEEDSKQSLYNRQRGESPNTRKVIQNLSKKLLSGLFSLLKYNANTDKLFDNPWTK